MKAVSAEEAIAMIPNGATVMVGGFMGVGTPERLLDELVRQNKSQLAIIANDAAVPGRGLGKLFDASLVARLTVSHIGLNPEAQKQMMATQGEIMKLSGAGDMVKTTVTPAASPFNSNRRPTPANWVSPAAATSGS